MHVRLWIAALKDQRRNNNLVVEVDPLTRSARFPQLTRMETGLSDLLSKASRRVGCRGMPGECRPDCHVAQDAYRERFICRVPIGFTGLMRRS